MHPPTPKRSKILITGGAGFVGSQLGYYLSSNDYEVILMDDMSSGQLDNLVIEGKTFGRLVVKDIRAPLEELRNLMKDVDVVYHFAGCAALPVCQSDPQLAYDVNVSGTGNVLEAARLAGVKRIIFSSTSAIYENTKSASFKESDEVMPDLVYSMTKHAAEQLCKAYSVNYGLETMIVRFFNCYGPHQDFKRTSPPFTSYLAREFSNHRTPIMYNDDPNVRRDYVHVDDLIRLLVGMLRSSQSYYGEVFNACSGSGISAPAIFDIMRGHAKMGNRPEFRDPKLFWEPYQTLTEGRYPLDPARITKEVYKNSIGDATKAFEQFNWRAKTSMEDGLLGVYQYALQHQ
ncbi:UDP-glucose 4-epimerase [Patellaria atrata CBS 101060]|uniref:UDP-glucose 4-epimerase n=1 Tax=Patellaria atrata CBS 101060 TaxID=1346257 RepID=A0A9P4VRI5_9PEZI|nr:UDP-glucose 4-epimerase [Patellaria atrata CBS 101060]